MSELEKAIINLIDARIAEKLGDLPIQKPDLITIEDAAEICSVHRSVIDSLVKDRKTNGFPAVKFGERSIKIDRNRLYLWIGSGGLSE
jgi:predicted DNA-binding transcriptional regulator AlpA